MGSPARLPKALKAIHTIELRSGWEALLPIVPKLPNSLFLSERRESSLVDKLADEGLPQDWPYLLFITRFTATGSPLGLPPALPTRLPET